MDLGFGGFEGFTGVRVGTLDKEPTWKSFLSLKLDPRGLELDGMTKNSLKLTCASFPLT